jgi:glycosyltransferase involved in cell wall biosynthesis
VARDKLVTVPLASVFEPHALKQRHAGPMRLLFAGRMIGYKGVDMLADAVERIAARDDWRLTIAGFGPALDDAAAARFKHPQVERISNEWLSDDALETLIADCDILLAPYRSATQSGVVAQALACGKPCVVCPVGALVEQISGGEAGWIAAATTPDAFAAALTQALKGVEHSLKARAAQRLAEAAWKNAHWAWLSVV